MDDDIILEATYLREILKVYEMKPDALGVQGYMLDDSERPNFWRKIFFQPYFESGTCRVFPSIRSTYPLAPDTLISCERLAGGNSAYRRSILAEFPFDESLLKYSFGEDLDQSYRVFKRYPGSLWLTPFARSIHKASPVGRATSQEHIYIREVYGLYLFYKLFVPTPYNQCVYWWSFLGRLLGQIKHPSRAAYDELAHMLGALGFCLRHLREIQCGSLESFNRTLVNDRDA